MTRGRGGDMRWWSHQATI